jgi:D-3-phosphoglycerate dehydrogenase / 2-oxoglutarate reductase
MTMPRILVSPRSITSAGGHPSLEKLSAAGYEVVFTTAGKQPSEEELLDLLPGCIGFLAGVENISRNVLEASGELKVISRNGTGINNVDLNAAKQLNIKVCNTPGANARGVAELTIAHLFSLARHLPLIDREIKAGKWVRKKGIELKGRTLGLIGCGMIGKEVGLLALGLGMKVVAYDEFSSAVFTDSPDFKYVDLSELLSYSDFISFHCPVPDDRKPIFDKEMVEKVKTGVMIINTARGELVDSDAVLEGINKGKIRGMAVDVFESEPPEDDRLTGNDQIICSSHIGGYTEESVDNAMDAAVDNLLNNL